MIGSIGGTFGLCIGVSFKDFFRDVRSLVRQALVRPPQLGKGMKTKIAENRQALKTEHLHLSKVESLEASIDEDNTKAKAKPLLDDIYERLIRLEAEQKKHQAFLQILNNREKSNSAT